MPDPIRVKTPQGVVEFPFGTSPDDITKALSGLTSTSQRQAPGTAGGKPFSAEEFAPLGQVNIGQNATYTANGQPIDPRVDGPAPGVAGGKPYPSENFTPKPADVGLGGALSAAAGGFVDNSLLGIVKGMFTNSTQENAIADKAPTMVGALWHRFLATPPGYVGKFLAGIPAQQAQMFVKAKSDWETGDHSSAIGHFTAGLLPLLGPMAADVGENLGSGDPTKMARSGGQMLAMALPAVMPKSVTVGGGFKAKNPQLAQAVNDVRTGGVPLDAATATGNPYVGTVQQLTDNATLGGALLGPGQRAATDAGMAGMGKSLSETIKPGSPINNVSAGQTVVDLLTRKAKQYQVEAKGHYQAFDQGVSANDAAAESGGVSGVVMPKGVSPLEYGELRRMAQELSDMPYQKRTFTETAKSDGNAGHYDIVSGSPNAPVYQDIAQGQSVTGATLQKMILNGLEGKGRQSVWFNRALDVARRRLDNDTGVSRPMLPPEAGYTLPGGKVIDPRVQAAVDEYHAVNNDLEFNPAELEQTGPVTSKAMVTIKPIQDALTPMVQQMTERLTPGDAQFSKPLKALQTFLARPESVTVQLAERDLGALKGLTRGTPSMGMTQPQGSAAWAIGQLDRDIQNATLKVSQDALDSLKSGREMTAKKHAVLDLLEQVQSADKEPGKTFSSLMRSDNMSVGKLNAVFQEVPAARPVLGRGWLEEQLSDATAEGGFNRGRRLWAKWDGLGDAMQKTLYPDAAMRQKIGSFMQIAKKLEERPNPSGTAPVATVAATVGSAISGLTQGYWTPLMAMTALQGASIPLSVALHSPRFVSALVDGLTIPLPKPSLGAMTGIAAGAANTSPALAGVPVLTSQTNTPGVKR